MEALRKEIEEYTAFLRQALQLTTLTPRGRRARLGRWFGSARAFAKEAARALARSGPHLALDHTSQDILAQEERVRLLEEVQSDLLQLGKELADTLLKERTDLYDMSTAVMRALHQKVAEEGLVPAARRQVQAALAPLRRAYDLGRGGTIAIGEEVKALAPRHAPKARRR